MRYHEILEAAANIPQKALVDPDTGLILNSINQWSTSPYLGAVKNSKGGGGFYAQVHVPQEIWREMVQQNPAKWRNAPETFFNETGQNRSPMKLGTYADPRQAAWVVQEVLYGGDWSARDVIEDYYEHQYCGGKGELCQLIKSEVPSFDGEALQSDDAQEFFANPEGFKKAKDAKQIATNTSEYARTMPIKIKKALLNFYSKNLKSAQKRLGQQFRNEAELEQAIGAVVDEKGIDYFMTRPGATTMKDVASLSLK